MKVSAKIYAHLSPAERIRAAILAIARDDKAELEILKKSCPKITFLMTDPAYSEGMANLFSLLFSVEHALTICALDFQMARGYRGKRTTQCDIQERALQDAASIVVALGQFIAEMGLDPEAMAINAPPRHPLVAATIMISKDEEDSDLVEGWLQHMRERVAT